MVLYPGARKLLDALHDKYIRVAVCTDLLAHIQHRKLRALGMMDDVDCLVTSEEAGAEKPSHVVYDLCLKKLRLTPEEVCFVALAAGMKAVWFNPEKKEVSPEMEQGGYSIVSDYEELYQLLNGEIQGGL